MKGLNLFKNNTFVLMIEYSVFFIYFCKIFKLW